MISKIGVIIAFSVLTTRLTAQADKAPLFAHLDSLGKAVRMRATDQCQRGLELLHTRHCDAVWDSAKALEDSIRNLHYRNSAGIDVDSSRKARGSRWLAECFLKDENTPTCKALRADDDVPGAAQKDRGEAAQGPQIMGFAGFPWGASSASVIAKRGTPGQDNKAALGARFIMYQESVLSDSVTTFFAFDSTGALMRGGYVVPFSPMGNACERKYQKFQEAITERYGNIKPEEQRHNGSSLEFCSGVTIGEASWDTQWKDGTGEIEIWLAPEAKLIFVYYDSPVMKKWLKDSKAAEERSKF